MRFVVCYNFYMCCGKLFLSFYNVLILWLYKFFWKFFDILVCCLIVLFVCDGL